MTIRASIIGASGYGGGELARLLVGHPEVTLVHLGAESRQGDAMADLYPNLRGLTSATTGSSDAERVARDSDVVFLALPAGTAMGLAPAMLEHIRIVDLGADFRFKDPQVYEQWYRAPHGSPGLLDEAVYGLTEFRRSEIRRARVVGNPGCYPTAALPLAGRITTEEATAMLEEAYAGEPFVRVLAEGLPQTKATTGSNFCDVAVRVDGRAGVAVAMSALDNLVKGASGQAVQNMNVMFGLPEETGLRAPGLYP